MKFQVDTTILDNVTIPKVKLDSETECKAAEELTLNCGCGGLCLASTT